MYFNCKKVLIILKKVNTDYNKLFFINNKQYNYNTKHINTLHEALTRGQFLGNGA